MSDIIDCAQPGFAPADLRCEVVIIGSGCGGATAARVLAEAGRDVVLLEEGGDFVGPERLTQRDLTMYDQLYAGRGARTTSDRSIAVQSGRVLGGGGVINACDVVPVAPETWRFWQTKHGLTDFSPEAMRPFEAKALEDLSANPIREDQLNRNNLLLRQGAQALGWRGEVMRHNRQDCKGLGSCLIGCPVGAKRNPRMVAIPKALAAGARILTRARAIEIRGGGRPQKTVVVRTLDAKGYHPQAAFNVHARVVIVAANPVGTVQLLLASGIGNDLVGHFLSLQPQIPITALMPEPVDAFVGIPQAYAVTEFEQHHPERGLSGFRIEPIFGTPGVIGSMVTDPGPEGKQLMARMRHLAASLLLVPDESVGRIRRSWASGKPIVDYAMTDEYRQRGRQAIAAAAKLYLTVGAESVLLPTAPPLVLRSLQDLGKIEQAVTLAPATLPLISAHQQGGMRMAPTPELGPCDPHGQVWGAPGVYVMDGSVFPSSSSSHTMTPILTMAHYLAGRLAAEWPLG